MEKKAPQFSADLRQPGDEVTAGSAASHAPRSETRRTNIERKTQKWKNDVCKKNSIDTRSWDNNLLECRASVCS